MKFEFDPKKSQSNKKDHGIDFEEAQKIWDDVNRIETAPATSYGEVRWYAIGMMDGVLWTATYTIRGESIRLISVRRSRDEEKWVYEN